MSLILVIFSLKTPRKLIETFLGENVSFLP